MVGPDHTNQNPNTKICTHCRDEKPLDLFSRHPLARKGRKQICKACDKIQGRKNHDQRLIKAGKTRAVRLGGVVETSTARKGDVREDGMVFFSKRNRPDGKFQEWWMPREQFEARKAAQSARIRWRYHNDSEYREKERQQNMSERQRAAKRRWNKANSIHLQEYFAIRRASVSGHQQRLTPEEKGRAREYYMFRNILNRVHGKRMFEVDHIRPIARGGVHHPNNLRVTTAVFNHRKFVNRLCPATLQKTGTY